MVSKVEELLAAAKRKEFTPAQQEEQRRSFAYGNTQIENSRITRTLIDQEAEQLRRQKKK